MGKARFLIITGMSGAGKSLTLKMLEDLDFFCVDNLPPALIPKFAELYQQIEGSSKNVALVVDIRGGGFFPEFTKVLAELSAAGLYYQLLFLDCDDEPLICRYKETRRRHPLSPNGRVSHGIMLEREALAGAREMATNIINTSNMKAADLREKITEMVSEKSKEASFHITILSFGFKYGLPKDADLVFDVRFLPNPFYVPELKYKSGATKEVAEYINKKPVTRRFLFKLEDMLDFLIPLFIIEGRVQTVIAVGCTGGMHRSVFVANKIAAAFRTQGYTVHVEHRDIARNAVTE